MRPPVAFVLCVVIGCGSVPAATPRTAPETAAVAISLRTSASSSIHTDDLRGRPVILIMLATFDGVSQGVAQSAAELARLHPEVSVIGVLLQPDAEQFAPLYREAIDLPYPIATDSEGVLRSGASPLGVIDAVPTIVILDPSGSEGFRHVGYQSLAQLERAVESLSRARDATP